MVNNVPKGWTSLPLREILGYVIGGDWGIDYSDNYSKDYKPVYIIRGTELKRWRYEKGKTAVKRLVQIDSITKRELQDGDLLIEISGGGPDQPVGRTVLIDKSVFKKFDAPLICTNFFRLVRLPKSLDSNFINYQLVYYYNEGLFDKYQSNTTNLRNLSFTKLADELKVLIAPHPEQKRIASKLDKLFNNINLIQSRLDEFPNFITELRQQVLRQAVTGQLTKGWRKKNKEKWEEDLLDKLFKMNSGKILSVKNRKKGSIKVYGGNGFNGYHNQFNEQGENIIIGRVGVNCGNVHYYKGKVWVTDNAISMKPKTKMVVEYFSLMLRDLELNKLSGGTGQPYISQDLIAPLVIKYPPISEQKEILLRIKIINRKIDKIVKQYQSLKIFFDELPQTILGKAYSGKLVPQNPKDEPVEKLLERIQKEKLLQQKTPCFKRQGVLSLQTKKIVYPITPK